jgi:tRNA splicing endonuclease
MRLKVPTEKKIGVEMTQKLLIEGVVDGKLLLSGDIEELQKYSLGFYSKIHKAYLLDVSEVALIIHRKLADVIDSEGIVTLTRLFKKYRQSQYDWIKFTVLLDLRTRGRKAKAGYSANTLIYEKGGSKVMVYVTEENTPIKAGDIAEWVDSALKKGYEPILAVVDAHGDVTYYTIYTMRVDEIKKVITE